MRRLGIVLILLAACDKAPDAPKPLVQVQGTSFDVPAKVEAPPPPPQAPEPVVAKVVPKPEVKPEPQPEAKPEPPKIVEAPKPVEPPKPVPPVEAPKPARPAEASAKVGPVDDKPMTLSFAKLNFRYWPKPKSEGAPDPFPKDIKALHGKLVTIDGYMFPIDFEKGKVRSFMLSRGMFGCCYGDTPQITEIITVSRADGKPMPFEAMARVTGTLEVGEVYDGEGFVDSVYRIKADSVGPAPGVK